ncbi:unnamed protein product [Mytilus edulis]|uniref:Uncharacterized protein n=1 Tax=Mytilus edulis TaxID=6550 RepID=A0A8S3TFG9_MYTED|nr:unnamed protein product [Mytilus edulis]
MFGRLMSKVFGIEKKTDESSSKERRHSFEDTSPRKHQTRSKGKKRSTPEAKRQRSEEPPLGEKDPTAVDTDKSDDYIKLTQSKTSGESASPECVVNPPSPDQPVLVDGPAMSASTWESVDTSTTKEHVYKDCVVIETTSEHKDRLSKEFQCLPDNSEGKVQLSTDSFIKVEEASEDMTSLNDKNWNNMNASAFLDIDMPTESESRRLTTSFVHIDQKDVFGLEESKNNAESEVRSAFGELGNLETVDELSISSSDKNSNAQDVITFGANSSKQQSEHDSMSTNDCGNTEEKNQSTEVKKTESMIENGNYNVDADAKYVVPKMPVSKGQGGNKLSKKLEKRERWKEKKRKSKTPEKSLTKKIPNLEDAGKENSSGLQQENNEVFKEGEEKILASDVKTDSTNIKEKRGRNKFKEGRKTSETREEKKEEKYETEPKNFLEFVQRKTAKGVIVDAKKLMFELGFLKDVKQTDIHEAVIDQYKMAADRKKDTKEKNQTGERKEEKRKSGHSEYDRPAGGMCRDVRLETDPSLQVVRENIGSKSSIEKVAHVGTSQKLTENTKKELDMKSDKNADSSQRLSDSSRSSRMKYSDVRLETNPNMMVVRENAGSRSKDQKEKTDRSLRMKYSDVRLETNPNLMVVRENAGSKSKNQKEMTDRSLKMKYSDVRLETNPNLNVVRENAGSRSKDQKEKLRSRKIRN